MAATNLVTELKSGAWSPTAFVCALYDEHAERIRGLLIRLLGAHTDVDDLLQQVFEIALSRAGVVAAQPDAGAWLCGVAVKLCRSRRRTQRLRLFLGLEHVTHLASTEDAARLAESNSARRSVYAALDALSDKKRTVFILYELEGLSGEAIAELLDCPLKTVWSRLAHARAEFDVALRRVTGEPV